MQRKRLCLAALILSAFVLLLASFCPVWAADEDLCETFEAEYAEITVEHEDNGILFGQYAAKLFGIEYETGTTGEEARSDSSAGVGTRSVKLTGAGATFPYRKDPRDSNLRIAPTYPTYDELQTAMELFCVCVKLACVNKLLETAK